MPAFVSAQPIGRAHPARTGALSPRRPSPRCSGDKPGDVVERLFARFFGAKEAEPFGLKRFDRDRFPELYYATLDEFADPVVSDDATAALFRPLLARTQLQSRALQLVYDASRDGWSAEAFHTGVDRRGACVVLARTPRAVFGGYAPKGMPPARARAFPRALTDGRRLCGLR